MNKDPGGVALTDMTKNPSYVTTKEAMSTSFASGTEEAKEVDHTYEVLPFEASREGQEGTMHGGLGGAADYVHVYAN